FDVSSSENMGDSGLPPVSLPNESTSIRSLTALPPVPAPHRNTRKLLLMTPLKLRPTK
ncbi:hypothetical protein S245_010251, partial [Arachis hypogaea]